ncbi:hypothetical protein BDM02DRAFT_1441802 [Thelephora ganbajun]|uniref:Uncharacterized protein n=1 Tax=Thelephora ganbajun TaxID=370292 RepID=A0ACB6Z1T5_THEGA|nr:hypothetical protein BDM02DRAFT_1441802 [Thelephora ganbajun]
MPRPNDTTEFYSYVLVRTKWAHEWRTGSRQGEAPRGGTGMDLVWGDRFQFSYGSGSSTIFLQEDGYGKNYELAVFRARPSNIQQGWPLAKLFNMKGNDSGVTLLISLALEGR